MMEIAACERDNLAKWLSKWNDDDQEDRDKENTIVIVHGGCSANCLCINKSLSRMIP